MKACHYNVVILAAISLYSFAVKATNSNFRGLRPRGDIDVEDYSKSFPSRIAKKKGLVMPKESDDVSSYTAQMNNAAAIDIELFINDMKSETAFVQVGETVDFSYIIRNIGSTNLTIIRLIDDQFGPTSPGLEVSLAVGEQLEGSSSITANSAMIGKHTHVITVHAVVEPNREDQVEDSDTGSYIVKGESKKKNGNKQKTKHHRQRS